MRIENVCFAYEHRNWHLKNVSLDIYSGEIVGIIGPNGAGKSTLLKIAAGILTEQSGNVNLLGRVLSEIPRRQIAKNLGYLPQNVTSIFDYRAEELVAMGRFPHLQGAGFLQQHDLRQVDLCMRQTETIEYRDRPLSQLSGGERQRVLLASVLAQQPDILLLDEPTTGLDLHHQVAFFQLLSELAKNQMAVAVVTHDLNLAAQFADRLLLLRDGKTVKTGTVPEVIQQNIIKDVYRNSVYVDRHPLTGKPITLPFVPKSIQN